MDEQTPRWFKSSHSDAADGGCVEAALSERHWAKSSHSDACAHCVEVAFSGPTVMLVRDTRNRAGAVLGVGASDWVRLVRLISGEV
ncbi:hypothetical protein BJF83_01760 [Nocardiopsis sp. CNR-923]|uniref:DUF397 domain-containing protein n=1 Tax=Nocardiopsis sp. CNR-923 TaxID=1904965 RepID=UPI0009658416|nr:DUF397 domain-containing protein [Nocardiopsis sp. CNR-923]OLT28208.1 hypothetical protein BJF83_01760 [Nocardiopsis sp. CNR-923]